MQRHGTLRPNGWYKALQSLVSLEELFGNMFLGMLVGVNTKMVLWSNKYRECCISECPLQTNYKSKKEMYLAVICKMYLTVASFFVMSLELVFLGTYFRKTWAYA